MPGDPIDIMAASTPGMTAETIARLKAAYGLDQPLMTRYWHWLTAALQLDFGYSRVHSQPAIDVIVPALAQTVKLAGLSLALSLTLALILGVASALKPGGWIDTMSSLFAFAGISVPTFWLAIILILGFAVGLGWLPASGMGDGIADQARHMVLPVATLTIALDAIHCQRRPDLERSVICASATPSVMPHPLSVRARESIPCLAWPIRVATSP